LSATQRPFCIDASEAQIYSQTRSKSLPK